MHVPDRATSNSAVKVYFTNNGMVFERPVDILRMANELLSKKYCCSLHHVDETDHQSLFQPQSIQIYRVNV